MLSHFVFSGVYQPYQQQQYNFGPYQQYYHPASGYPVAAAGTYPTAYSSQSTVMPYYPTPYSAYQHPYVAQPYHGGSYSSYPIAFQLYNGQFVAAPSVSPYSSQYAAASTPSVTPYSALPLSAYQPQQSPQSSFYNHETANQLRQYSPFQDYHQSSQQYPSFYSNSPKVTNSVVTDSPKVSVENK